MDSILSTIRINCIQSTCPNNCIESIFLLDYNRKVNCGIKLHSQWNRRVTATSKANYPLDWLIFLSFVSSYGHWSNFTLVVIIHDTKIWYFSCWRTTTGISIDAFYVEREFDIYVNNTADITISFDIYFCFTLGLRRWELINLYYFVYWYYSL